MKVKRTVQKVVALGAGALMMGATLFGAMAADLSQYPAPFVKDGKFDALIVVGDSAAASDVVGAIDVAAALQYSMKQVVVTPGTATTTIENSAKIETGSTKLYYNDQLLNVKSAITSSDLPTLFKSGSIVDKNGTTYTYTVQVKLGSQAVNFGKTVPETDKPILYLDSAATTKRYNITLDFPTAVYFGGAGGKTFTLFGKEYVVSDTAGENSGTAGSEKITFYTAAVDQTFSAGQSATINVGGSDVTVEVIGVNTQPATATATVKINGESKSVTAGETAVVGGQRIYVKDIFAYTQPVGGGGVRLFIGSNKVVFEQGQTVATGSAGSDSVDGTKVIITSSDGKISRLSIEVAPYSLYPAKKVVKVGESITDPVFGAFKFQFTGPTLALDDAAKSFVKVIPSAEDRVRLEFTAYTGLKYAMDFFKADSSTGGFNLSNGDYPIQVNTSAQIFPDHYFVIGNGEYQHVLRLQSVRNSSTTTEISVKDAADAGATQKWSFSSVDYTGTMVYDGNSFGFTATVDSSDAANSFILMTSGMTNAVHLKGGPKLVLVPEDATTGIYLTNFTHENQRYVVNLTEKTTYSTGKSPDDYGQILVNFTYSNGRTGNDIYLGEAPVFAIEAGEAMSTLALVGNSGYDNEQITAYGTLLKYNSDTTGTTSLQLYVPDQEVSYGVWLAPTAAVTTVSGGTSSVTISKIQVGSAKLASEITDVTAQNLIVVGGPCANAVASKLMGNPAICTAGFEEGKAVVKLYSQSTGKVAMLIAGLSASDTRRASKAVADGKLSALPAGTMEASVTTVTDTPTVTVVSK